MQYSRGDISRDVVAAMGQSAASIVASSTYYSAYYPRHCVRRCPRNPGGGGRRANGGVIGRFSFD